MVTTRTQRRAAERRTHRARLLTAVLGLAIDGALLVALMYVLMHLI